MPVDPSELPEMLRAIEGANRGLLEKLAPLRQGKCPKCLTTLVDGRGPGSRVYPKACPACGWGREDPPVDGGGECGLCGAPLAD